MLEQCSVAANLREARQAAGLRREVVAVSIGKACSSIAAYESGTVEPPLRVLRELARIYGVRLVDLLAEEEADADAA